MSYSFDATRSISPIQTRTINPIKTEPQVFKPDSLKISEPKTEEPQEENLVKKYSSFADKITSNKFSFKVDKSAQEGGGGDSKTANPNSIQEKFHLDTSTSDKGLTDTVDLNSREKRIDFANSTTQLEKTGGIQNEYGCGASCIVNGAMIQGGQKGLEDLITVVKYNKNESFTRPRGINKFDEIPGWNKLDDIEKRVMSNKVTRQDLLDLQKIIYHQLRHIEKPDNNGGDNTAAIQTKALQKFINTDMSTFGISKEQPLKNVFSNMNIKLLDTDKAEDNKGEHFALFFNKSGKGDENAIFDPWPRKDGNQVVSKADELEIYHKSVVDSYR
ncbi:MAG: hypothetical protein U0457_05735 [Candidatus Sericytochromatia bacterium]